MGVRSYDISTLEHYLELLSIRPLLLLAWKEIDLLDANIKGYTIGNSVEADNSSDYLMEFHEFLLNEYGLETSNDGWRNTILRKVNNDQEKAFEEFFRLIDRYKKQKNTANKQ